MDNMQPITIRRGTFVCNIYDVGNLMRLPLGSVRKLWKIMFSCRRTGTGKPSRPSKDWLPRNIESTKQDAQEKQELFLLAAKEAGPLCREISAFGSAATKKQKAALAALRRELKASESAAKAAKTAHVKAQKLQTIFNNFTTK